MAKSKLSPDGEYELCNHNILVINDFLSCEMANFYFEELSKLNFNTSLNANSAKHKNIDQLWYGASSYHYANVKHNPNPILDQNLKDLLNLVNSRGYVFDAILINRYNSDDGIGWHSDDEIEMDDNQPILCLRLGHPRDICFKSIKNSKSMRLLIDHGSAYVMPPGLQKVSKHSVSKSTGSKSPTISLTFRKCMNSPSNLITIPHDEPSPSFASTISNINKLDEISRNFSANQDAALSSIDLSNEMSKKNQIEQLSKQLKDLTFSISNTQGGDIFNLLKPLLLEQVNSLTNAVMKKIEVRLSNVEIKCESNLDKINSLQEEMKDLKKENSNLVAQLDANEQYSKRLNLLILGQHENNVEQTNEIFSNICQTIGSNLKNDCIERSHRLGKNSGQTRPIIFKFKNYNDRKTFIFDIINYNKSSSSEKIVFRDHLTNARLTVFKKAVEHKGNGLLDNVSSRDGMIRLMKNNNVKFIKTLPELEDFISKSR